MLEDLHMFLRTSLIALTLTAVGTAAQAGPLCDAARTAAPGRPCAESEHGVALAFTQARADELLGVARRGEDEFQSRFGVAPSRYVVSETGATGREDRAEALKTAGFAVVVPWRLRQAQINAEVGALRGRFTEMMTANGMSDEQINQALEQPLARMRERHTPEAMAANEAGTIPRLLGAAWYARAFWPETAPDPEARHASPGPDWMDEIAGQLLETPAMSEDKRTQFGEIYSGRHRMAPKTDAAKLLDLSTLLSGEHPIRSMAAAAGGAGAPVRMSMGGPPSGGGGGSFVTGGPGGPRIMMGGPGGGGGGGSFVFGGGGPGGPGGGAGPGGGQSLPAPMLYGFQARLFADYLAEKSGDPAVFGRLGRAFGAGTTFEAWLAGEGTGLGLPSTVEALTADWRTWLQGRLGAPAA